MTVDLIQFETKIAHDCSRVVGDYFLFRHAITIAMTMRTIARIS